MLALNERRCGCGIGTLTTSSTSMTVSVSPLLPASDCSVVDFAGDATDKGEASDTGDSGSINVDDSSGVTA